MEINPFGELSYTNSDNGWFGRVKKIHPDFLVELCVEVDSKEQDISERIELIRQLASDYESVMSMLYEKVYMVYENTLFEKPLEEIKKMYFLAAITLKNDGKSWWIVLEPHPTNPSIHDHFLRFTLEDRKITWTNFE